MTVPEEWLPLATATPLAIVTDLDGTLIPFAETPAQARPGGDVVALLDDLAATPGVTVAVVSGRPRESMTEFFGGHRGLILVAEHGAWRLDEEGWRAAVDEDASVVEDLTDELEGVAATHAGAIVERKTWSVAFHYRAVQAQLRDGAVVEAEHLITRWLAQHEGYEELRGAFVLEVRPRGANKGLAVDWVREHAGPGVRVLALGDQLTDEDTFAQLGEHDAGILVGELAQHASLARWNLGWPGDALAFLRWIAEVRRRPDAAPAVLPSRVEPDLATGPERFQLLVVSNRLPELRSASESSDPARRHVGGLVSALEPVLRLRKGVWLGWSGRTVPGSEGTSFDLDASQSPRFAAVDLPEEWHRLYYNGFCNRVMWPLLHSFPDRVRIEERHWDAYRLANDAFATSAARLVGPDDTVWAHDYHLFLLGERLRQRGHRGPIGLFLHVPFPGPDIWFLLPWADELLGALLHLDLIGFHTAGYVANFKHCVQRLAGARIDGDVIHYRGRQSRVGAFPIGILPDTFQEPASDDVAARDVASLMRSIAPTRLILGVDRLDYTKGIPERLAGFARLLELHPEWRRLVSLVQISVPSRGDVPEYAEQRNRIERIVGRANGELGDADWVPIRYLYRSFAPHQLALLYRSAAVGYVTPLRDGMNLVAKEYVAAQDPKDPGVLVLSRFAGAAEELSDAVLTNPWHADGMARDLDRALRMGLEERIERHEKLLEVVSRTTALTWAEDFLAALSSRS